MGYLKYIELDNFKSYKGSIKIGPFKTFTAIIGPNGSGKSNLMDAISFVLGESTKNLRVKKLSDLIHGAPIGKPVAHRASVSFVYSYEAFNADSDEHNRDNASTSSSDTNGDIGKEIKFTRTVVGSSSEYRIDGKVANAIDYQNELEKIGIYLKAKNFLVYQGQVESIAIKNAKEITQVFEEISRSIELKDEYDKLKTEMEKAELETQANFQKKRGVAAQKKEARLEKEEAEKYQKIRNELHEQELQLRLFQLYYNEKTTEDVRDELEQRQAEVKGLEAKRDVVEEEAREKKRQQGRHTREIAHIEDQIKNLELNLAKRKPQFIKAKESSSHLIKKLETSKTCYEAALKANETHKAELANIQAELDKLAAERDRFEKAVEKDAQSQGVSSQMRQSHMQQYQKLKEQASAQTAKHLEQLGTLQREQKLDQDALDNETRKRNDANLKIKQKEHELEEQRLKLNKLIEYIANTETQIVQQNELEEKMAAEIEKAKRLTTELEADLSRVMTEIGDAKMDKFESSRSQKRTEVIEQLKKKFPGVFGRMFDHCDPVHRKYQLAITKVMGKSIDAIVVDTERTARDCIQFLKEQHLQAETFYPLDYIDAAPIDERLRDIKEPRNTKMLIDVIKAPPQFKKALQFAVGNCLVCESDEDARQLAFNRSERHKVVSFDGTLFQKSGVLSGGASELRQKAKRWDDKVFDALRKRKDELTEQAKEQWRIRRREPELSDLRANIKGLEYRLKYSKTNREQAETKGVAVIERELDLIRRENSHFDPRIREIEKRMTERTGKIKQVRASVESIEDDIFRDFCAQVRVDNIRVYEERELVGQQEKVKERMVFEEKRARLVTQLEFERTRDTSKSYQKWQKDVQENEKELAKLKREEEQLLQGIREIEGQIETRRADIERHRAGANEFEADIAEVKKRLSVHNKEINDLRKKINSIEAKLLDKKLERHAILKNAKLELIDLPMIHGSMDDIADEAQLPAVSQASSVAGGDNTESDIPNTFSTSEQSVLLEKEARIRIDYRRLDTDLLNIENGDEIDKAEARILGRLNELKELLHHFQAPNVRVDEKLDTVTEMWESTAAEFDKARLVAKKARNAFVKIKQERYERFMKCFDYINARIDDIYKALCMNQGAQASLVLENVEEPYAEGIIYNCVAPGKRFRQMDNLSGGEKTVAALGLLFAIRSFNPSPFFVLDEVDAALDNTNISKVANYINEQSKKGLQCIVISLKEEFFQHAHSLIGVYPVANDCIASEILSLDLTDVHEE